jgi:hypothetical protein
MKNLRHTGLALVAALALATVIAACGGGSSGGGSHNSTTSGTAQLDQGDRAFLAFTQCMRHHGVHMSDPYHRAGHSGLTLDVPAKTPATIRALGACQHIIASVIAMKEAGMRARQSTLSPQQATARHLGLLHYAQCMRAHGVPMLDPDANGNLDLGNVPGIAGVGRYTSVFRDADHGCRRLLPAGVADNGTGP